LLLAVVGLLAVGGALRALGILHETLSRRAVAAPKPRRAAAPERRWAPGRKRLRVDIPRPAWRPLIVAGLGAAFLAIVLVGGAFAYDASKEGVIASGVRVGPVDVGGLGAGAARRKLERAYRRLDRPLAVRFERRRFVLSPRRIGLAVDIDEAVARALARSHAGWFVMRAVRSITGRGVRARVGADVSFSAIGLVRFAARVESAVERQPRAASVVPAADRLVVERGSDGIDVRSGPLLGKLEHALTHLGVRRAVEVPVRRTRPLFTVADLARRYPSYIAVDRESFQLRVYQHLKLARTYSIAVGQVGLETPAGLYHIQDKQVDPSWSVPTSAWAGSLGGAVIPPGPSNPIKARWLGIFAGAGIHGTEETWSLGHAASHGCIRMAVSDVIDLYDRVQVGTPIYIG
jgi:lipoprotein-anchoring transpeptidase ErfK/SrfK